MVVWMPNGATSGLQRLCPPLKAELGGAAGGIELEAHEARARGDRDDVAGALLSHNR